MMRRTVTGFLLLLALQLRSALPQAEAQTTPWEPINDGINDSRLVAVAIDPRNARLVYAGSTRAVYRSEDSGVHWRQRFRASGKAEVTFVAVDPFDSGGAMAATTGGLYATADRAEHWSLVFRGATAEEARCQVVTFHPSRRHEIWLGTAGGVFVSHDGGRGWQPADLTLSHRSIRYLAFEPILPHHLYVLTDHELFVRRAEETTWQQLFRVDGTQEPAEDVTHASEEPATDVQETPGHLTSFALDPKAPTNLYLSSLNGAYTSADGGATWQPLTQLGLGTSSIRHLVLHDHSPAVLYAATSNGVARLRPSEQRWESLYEGLPTQTARFLAATDHRVFAATDQGLYRLDLTMEQLTQGEWPGASALLGNFVHEPTVRRVQDVAIRYAEVHPEKIANWRKQARLSALIPKLTVSGDTNLTDFRHWDSGANPDMLQKGERDIDWNASVTWDFGDFLYSDDQTNIDVRSKLMVELRDQILDDVTRSYFERRRIQVELMTDPPQDPKAQLTKELRIQELTAVLDGLTGGWFSKQLEPGDNR